MNMKLGEYLRKERKKLGLTQQDFVQNIISVSQYSRVENGEQDLKVSNFVKLISINNLDINQLIQTFQNNTQIKQTVLETLAQAFYDRDLTKIKKIKDYLKQNSLDNSLLLRTELIILTLENKDISHNKNLERQFSEELNKFDDWTNDKVFLQLFGSSMLIFDMDRLNIYMNKILSEYTNKIYSLSFEDQRRIAGICINYLNRCYSKKNLVLVNKSINLLNQLARNPDLLMYRLLGKYFKYLFNNENAKKDQILDLLKVAGYEKFTINLAK